MRTVRISFFAALTLAFPSQIAAADTFDDKRLNALVPELIKQEKVAGVAIAVVRNGKLDWTGYYGDQAPGAPVTEQTVFNTASVAKTITAETMIALETKGLIDLDEPIARYVRHPDLSKDPRYNSLTPRLLLSHRAGLLNWPYQYEDGLLAFDHEPDTRFSYSGAGIELAAQYAAAKTGQPLEKLAFEHVLTPLGITDLSMGKIPAWAEGRLATPMDNEGRYRSVEELNPGLAAGDADSAADDLLVTAKAYARLIEGLIESDQQKGVAVQLRTKLLTTLAEDQIYKCPDVSDIVCPDSHGHAIGWQVYRYDQHTVLKHSGSDAGENAFVYYSPDAKHGAVILVNGANGWYLMIRILEMIGDEPLIVDYYRGLIQEVMGRPMPPLDAAP